MNIPGWLMLDVCIFIIVMMLVAFCLTKRQRTKQDRAFLHLLTVIACLLAGDILSRCNAVGAAGMPYVLSRIGNYVIFAFDPVGYLFTMIYIDSWTREDTARKTRLATYTFTISYVLLNFVLVTISEIGRLNWFYSFPGRIYHRGPCYVGRGILNMFFCLVVCLYILLRQKDIRAEYKKCIAAFPLIVLISGFLQVFVGGASYEYAGTVYGCLMLYIYVQNHNVEIDYLTGILNRKGIDSELEYRIRHSREGKTFCAYMLDLDFFKQINDQCGHASGDDALRSMSKLMRMAFGRNAVIGRFGGDEFLIINNAQTHKEAEVCVRRLEILCRKFSLTGGKTYHLHFSVGYDVYSAEAYKSEDAYLNRLDYLMYEQKKLHHAVRV